MKESKQKLFKVWHYPLFIAVLIVGFWGTYLLLVAVNQASAPPTQQDSPAVSKQAPELDTTVVASGLDHPWEVAFLPDRTMLITERSGSVSKIVDGKKTELFKPEDVAVRGEGGMLGLAVDRDFDNFPYIYTCFNSNKSGLDIRVVRWRMEPDGSAMVNRSGDIVTGIPSKESERHSGCRLGFGADGNLWIGTGDAANENNPQNLQSLGGKILRVDRDGQPASDNNPPEGADKRIYSWGHRNTQGLAFYDKLTDGSYGVSAEHGSNRDDEVNSLVRGNFGWAPGAGYDESLPMTDISRFPDAIKSIWSSGNPTIAVADVAILTGKQWDAWEGRLAVGVLKDQHLMILEIKSNGSLGEQKKILDGEFGRLRAVSQGPDGALYVSTDNGSDKIIRLAPKSD